MTTHDDDEDLTTVLMVVSAQDHPHFGCTGYLTGKIIKLFGKAMAEVKADNCKHCGDGFFVKPGELDRVSRRRKP